MLRAVFGTEGDSELNRSYREFARYYGFKIDPTPPYAPKKKGKVESAVKYVKRNALAGREGEGITEANASLHRWRREIAGQRVHGTTGRCPFEIFVKEEQPTLKTLHLLVFGSRSGLEKTSGLLCMLGNQNGQSYIFGPLRRAVGLPVHPLERAGETVVAATLTWLGDFLQ